MGRSNKCAGLAIDQYRVRIVERRPRRTIAIASQGDREAPSRGNIAQTTYDLVMTGRELVELLERHGWSLRRITGSHHVMKKASLTLVVPVHGAEELKPGTQN